MRRLRLPICHSTINSQIALDSYENSADPTFASQAAGREKTFRKCLKIVRKEWRRPPGKLLDIGTANGSFLKVAKDAGWQVEGCEPNRWLGKWCEENYGIALTPGTVFDGHFEGMRATATTRRYACRQRA